MSSPTTKNTLTVFSPFFQFLKFIEEGIIINPTVANLCHNLNMVILNPDLDWLKELNLRHYIIIQLGTIFGKLWSKLELNFGL